MSDSVRPDLAAFRELEQLIRALGDEMAAWRRRAHEAEASLKASNARLAREAPESATDARAAASAGVAGRAAQSADGSSGQLVAALQRENQDLRLRLDAARQRTKQLLDRVRFLRQQHKMGSVER